MTHTETPTPTTPHRALCGAKHPDASCARFAGHDGAHRGYGFRISAPLAWIDTEAWLEAEARWREAVPIWLEAETTWRERVPVWLDAEATWWREEVSVWLEAEAIWRDEPRREWREQVDAWLDAEATWREQQHDDERGEVGDLDDD